MLYPLGLFKYWSPIYEWVVFLGHFGRLRVRVRVLSEIRSVPRLSNARKELGRHLLLRYFVPVDGFEPPVIFDIIGPIFEAAVPLGHVGHK